MDLIFFGLAAVSLISGVLVVFQTHPLRSALWLIVNFFAVAGVYLLLHAEFIAAIQIIVYAGAIMVLFLFIVMLLGLTPSRRTWRAALSQWAPAMVLGGLSLLLAAIMIAVRAHIRVRRKQAAPAMRSHQPGTLPSRWVASGRTRQNRSWAPGGRYV